MTSFEMESELSVCVDHYQEFAVLLGEHTNGSNQ